MSTVVTSDESFSNSDTSLQYASENSGIGIGEYVSLHTDAKPRN